jgi:hypothetical protein
MGQAGARVTDRAVVLTICVQQNAREGRARTCKQARKIGVPQGGPFSPLAYNIYLNEVDWTFDAIRQKTAEGEFEAVNYHRFADDMLITVSGHSKPQLLDHAVRIGVLSSWERERCAHLLWLRDVFSHPKGTFIELISWATSNISESCLWVNLMWGRFYKTLPVSFKLQSEKTPFDQISQTIHLK